MTPAEPGLLLYAHGVPGPLRIAGWDDDGVALVIPLAGSTLMRADTLSANAVDTWIEPDPARPIALLDTGGDWLASWDGGDPEPVAAWQLRTDGSIVPCFAEGGALRPADGHAMGVPTTLTRPRS